MRIRTEIITYTDRVVVISMRGSLTAWCKECDANTRMLTPEQAALVTRVNVETIYHWVAAGQVHGLESSEGSFFVCLNSLC